MKLHPRIKFLFLLLLSLTIIGCTSDTDPELAKKYKVGGLYSIDGPGGEFNVAKVIAITKGIVHIRTYKNKFPKRPVSADVDSSKLSLGAIDDPEGFGLRHMPMDKEIFEGLEPVFIRQENVTDEELQGFKDWNAEHVKS